MFAATEVTNPSVALTELHGRVSIEMNSDLSRAHTTKEVKEALHQMALLKAPSPKRYGTNFLPKLLANYEHLGHPGNS